MYQESDPDVSLDDSIRNRPRDLPVSSDSGVVIEEEEIQLYRTFLQQTLSGFVFYPFEYVKVLCQLGHEPIQPRMVKTLFGRTRYILPNVFQYIKHIKSTEGFFGCYNGLLPTVIGNLTSAVFTFRIVKSLKLTWASDVDPPNILNDEEPKQSEYIKYAKKEITINTVSLILSYPFRVVSVRMIASFIGKEEGYQSMFGAIGSIYRDNGLSGFYSGLVPRIIGDATCLGASIFFSYYINKYFVKSKETRAYVSPICLFTTSSVTYPLMVVSTCMAVNDSSLLAGNPPRMPIYPTWKTCLSDLIARRQHKRGGSLIFRYQT